MKLYIKDFKVADVLVDHSLAIKSLEKKVSKNNKEYYNVILSDKTGQIDAKIWSDYFSSCSLNEVKPGNVVKITGKVDSFNSTPQLIIEKMQIVKDYNPSDFLNSTDQDVEDLFKYIMDTIESLEDTEIKTVAKSILEDTAILKAYKQVPAGEYVHHNYVGGLVTHVVEMLKFAESSKSVYKNINFSELAFGVIFHDIGKVHELALNGVVLERTLAGYLVGHLGQGLMLVNNFFPKDFDEDKKNRLLHMLISHHGEREKGSPVQPMTLEAIILSEIDNLSFKAGTYFTHLEGSEVNDKGLTGYSKYLGTSILPS